MENKITFDLLNKRLKNYIPNQDIITKIADAYNFSYAKQKDNKRSDGSSLVDHSVAVAYILADLNVDETTIIASLLHESITTGLVDISEIKEKFGEEVALIIDNVSKINKLTLNDDSESSSIYLRKILVGMAEDVRVLFIKLADRLHNMQTIYYEKNDLQKQKLSDTINVLIPIAHRLGINSIKNQLEDLWLKHSKPDVYQDITERLAVSKDELNILIDQMIQNISSILNEHDLQFEIKGRVKSVYSIYEKLLTGRKFSDIFDILAMRLVFEKENDCYLAVGLIHSKYRPIPKRFKDFIAMPKENMYQSLHTTIFGIDGYLFEIQLRTKEMDEIAEHGIASHWSYKEKGSINTQNIMEQKLELFRNLIDNKDKVDENEFNKQIESEFLSNLIYVYTPKGDVVELPQDSNPIDFAYKIHSHIGDSMTGAIVNDKIVTLNQSLNDGDIVQIKTTAGSSPKKEWITLVKTSQARSKIKAFFSKQDHDEYLNRGRELLEKETKRMKLLTSEIFNDVNIKKIIDNLKLSDWDEVLFGLGSLRFTVRNLVNIISDDAKTAQENLISKVMNNDSKQVIEYKNDVIVAGVDDIKVNLASCCNPVYGDEIKGYITKGSGITIHRHNCHNISNIIERIIDVKWNTTNDKLYYSNLLISVTSNDNPVVDIVTKATIRNIQVDNLKALNRNDNLKYLLVVKTKNIDDLNNFIDDLINLKAVISASREGEK